MYKTWAKNHPVGNVRGKLKIVTTFWKFSAICPKMVATFCLDTQLVS